MAADTDTLFLMPVTVPKQRESLMAYLALEGSLRVMRSHMVLDVANFAEFLVTA